MDGRTGGGEKELLLISERESAGVWRSVPGGGGGGGCAARRGSVPKASEKKT